MCTDCNSTTLPEGIAGNNGYSPKLAVVTVTCDTVEHEILQLVSWVGGSGTRPFYLTNEMTDAWLTANPIYLSSTGWTLSGCAATFIEGTDGIYGGFSSNFLFSTTTSVSPSSTQLRFNSGTYGSVTRIWVSETNGSNVDVTDWLASFDNNGNFGTVRIFKEYDSTKFWYGLVTGVTDSGSYYTLDVTYIDHNSSFANNDSIVMSFTMNGEAASITVEETDGTPTGTPTIVKFGSNTLTYSGTGNNTVTYDPEGDWTNIPYRDGTTDNSLGSPYYTSTSTTEGTLVTDDFFYPYNGSSGGTYNSGTDSATRRLKYKVNDDKSISIAGHLEGTFTASGTTFNFNSAHCGTNSSNRYFTTKNLLRYMFPSAINDFGTSVQQFPCTIILAGGALGTVMASKPIIGTYPGMCNLTKDFIQIECLHQNNSTTGDITVVNLGEYSIHIVIEHTISKRSGA